MLYQAYRSNFAPVTNSNNPITSKTVLRFLLTYPQHRVPCGPIRSDFLRAYEDVKLAQGKGYYAAVLCVEF